MWRRPVRIIKGHVFWESNNNESGKIKLPLGNIGIKLYHTRKAGKENDTTFLKEIFINKTKTNASGEYSFFVSDGIYSVCMDLDTLPDGKGVIEYSTLINTRNPSEVNFSVRDIADIEVENVEAEDLHIGNEVPLNCCIKDKNGYLLYGNVSYSCDSDEIKLNDNRIKLLSTEFRREKINIIARAGKVLKQIPIEFRDKQLSIVEEVNLSYRQGKIDEKTRILYLLYLLFDRGKLSRAYGTEQINPIKSGTTILEDIKEYIKRKDADRAVVESARAYIDSNLPSLEKIYRSPDGFFDIHYSISGDNAVSAIDNNGNGIPDYIEQIGAAFDYVKSVTCSSRGFRQPLLDKGKNTFDVYVYNLKGVYGMTNSLSFYKDKHRVKNRASCYISIDNNYAPSKGFKKEREDCMKVTAAHEFFHAVQYAYNVYADKWWKEASATWNEDEIYSGINDYVQYIKNFFSSPQNTLEKSNYGGVVFAKYLSEKWGGYDIIKRVWEIQAFAYNNSINSIDRAIKERRRDQDISTVFNEFTAWNFNPWQYYKEGDQWKQSVAIQNTYNIYPVGVKTGRINHLAANYQLFKLSSSSQSRNLRIIIDGTNRIKWGFKIQKRKANDDKCELDYIPIGNAASRTEIIIEDYNRNYKEICLIPANLDRERDNVLYTYSASLISETGNKIT